MADPTKNFAFSPPPRPPPPSLDRSDAVHVKSPPPRPLITLGDYCSVTPLHRTYGKDSAGGFGFIKSVPLADKGEYKVYYPVDHTSEMVLAARITPIAIAHRVAKRPIEVVAAAPALERPPPPLRGVLAVRGGSNGRQSLLDALGRGAYARNAEPGWHRLGEWKRRGLTGAPSAQLTPEEKILLTMEACVVGGAGGTTTSGQRVGQSELNVAWGVHRGYASVLVDRMSVDGDPNRRVRSDAGKNILTDPEYAETRVTAFSVYCKDRHGEAPSVGTGRKFTAAELQEDFDKLRKPALQKLETRRRMVLTRLASIPDDIEDLLMRTNGSITWDAVSRHVGSEASLLTIRDYVMGLEGFAYAGVSTVPYLSAAQKESGYRWSKAFWVFWHSSKLVKLRIILVHSDEKVRNKPSHGLVHAVI